MAEPTPVVDEPGKVSELPYWLVTCQIPSGLRGCFRTFRVFTEREARSVFLCPECRGR